MFFSLPPVTQRLLTLNVAFFVLGSLLPGPLIEWFALWPLNSYSPFPSFMPWQLVSYSFLHEGFTHILFNMIALYMFGGAVEQVIGGRRFAELYFVSVVVAAFSQLAFAWWVGGDPYPTVGASGGVFGLLLAYGLFFPHRVIVLLIPPIPLPAWLFVTIYGVAELYMGVTGRGPDVAHFAHLGGMLGAWLLIRQWRRGRGRFL
jgi:membrane associated rhomboid family serine protease